jgi:hypothetical protein
MRCVGEREREREVIFMQCGGGNKVVGVCLCACVAMGFGVCMFWG